jgi:hypothetical protein
MSGSRFYVLFLLAALAVASEVGLDLGTGELNCSVENCTPYIWSASSLLVILPLLAGVVLGPRLRSRRAMLSVAVSTSGAALVTLAALAILEAVEPGTSDSSRSDLLAGAVGFGVFALPIVILGYVFVVLGRSARMAVSRAAAGQRRAVGSGADPEES